MLTEVEFKEFEPGIKFETRLKNGWFHLKLYLMIQDLSRHSIENRFLADLRRGSNSLNSEPVSLKVNEIFKIVINKMFNKYFISYKNIR